MKKSDKLRLLLKQMIREEVADQVNKAMGKILVEVLKEAKVSIPSPTQDEPEPEQRKQVIELKSTGNPKLDAILAETAKNHTPIPREEGTSLAGLMGGFDKIGRNEEVITDSGKPQTKIDFLKQMVGESVQPAQASVTETADVPDALKKVFKRDFRDVMKAMDRQKKEGTAGLFAGKVSLG